MRKCHGLSSAVLFISSYLSEQFDLPGDSLPFSGPFICVTYLYKMQEANISPIPDWFLSGCVTSHCSGLVVRTHGCKYERSQFLLDWFARCYHSTRGNSGRGGQRQLQLSVCPGPERGMNRKCPLYMLENVQTIVLSLSPGCTPRWCVEGVDVNLNAFYALALDESTWSSCCFHRFVSHRLICIIAKGKISVPVGNRVPVLKLGLCVITLMSLTYGVDVFSCNTFF
jgi:hypothetical protein